MGLAHSRQRWCLGVAQRISEWLVATAMCRHHLQQLRYKWVPVAGKH